MNSQNKILLSKIIMIGIAVGCLLHWISSPIALVLGIIYAQIFEIPWAKTVSKSVKLLLQIAVVGLGFGMNLITAFKVSQEGFGLTVLSICLTIALGYVLGQLFKLPKKMAYLISAGTAICGGSAIAAVSPILKLKPQIISLALGVVFLLNSIALILFPIIGHALDMTQEQFGLWAAIAIHDTSSVVGASMIYGEKALEVATTVKLARALWIIPLSYFTMGIFRNHQSKVKVPRFIIYFILAILFNTYIPIPETISGGIQFLAKAILILTIFLIGTGLKWSKIKETGVKPFAMGFVLWLFISIFSLVMIYYKGGFFG